jgi:hypothetical protein
MYAPQNRGIVSQLTSAEFLITYDWPANEIPRKRGQPRERYRYSINQAPNFVDESDEEVRVLEDDDTGLDIEIPAELLRVYGEQIKDD